MFKAILFAVLLVLVLSADMCDQKHLQECQSDVSKAYQKCQAAAKEKGQDQQADLDCVKYFNTMRVQCWPCICKIAQQQGYKIKGCNTFLRFENFIEALVKNY